MDKVCNRDNKGRFAKGNATGGRKKIPEEVRQMLLAATPDAAQTVIDLMRDVEAPPRVRAECAQVVLDRVLGKAVQPLAGSVELAGRVEIATEQDAAKALELLGYVRK